MRVYHSATPPIAQWYFGRLLVDIRHLPGVERFQDGGGALGAERYADAVVTSGLDAGGDALLVVDEYLDDAFVDEYAEAQRLVVDQHDRRRFRHSPAP